MDRENSVKYEKEKLRKTVKEKIKELSSGYLKKADCKIRESVLNMDEYRKAETVFCFVGTGDEISTYEIIRKSIEDGKKTVVPRCRPDQKGIMDAFEIEGTDTLVPGRYGIPEPAEGSRKVSREEIDFAVIPCISCDITGGRLGHGGGYYDRYLENAEFPCAVICREKLMADKVPEDIHDRKMDYIVTEKKVTKI